MKNFFSNYTGYNVSHSNSYIAVAFAVVVTGLMVGGYEVKQSVNEADFVAATKQQQAVARMDTIVVTAKRG